jgi:hypothetical protein
MQKVPNTNKEQTKFRLRENAHLRVRTNMFGAIMGAFGFVICCAQLFSRKGFV